MTFLLSTPLFLITTHPPACVFSNDIFPPFVRVKALAQTHIIKKHRQGFPYRCFFTISIYHFSIAPITFILLQFAKVFNFGNFSCCNITPLYRHRGVGGCTPYVYYIPYTFNKHIYTPLGGGGAFGCAPFYTGCRAFSF